jgi:hypothetical protein
LRPLFKWLFFACGSIGLLLSLVFIVVSFARDVPIDTSAIETGLELLHRTIVLGRLSNRSRFMDADCKCGRETFPQVAE